MLQNFRDNLKGVTSFFLVGIIIIPFALFGVDSLFLSGGGAEDAASVNGETISELRLQQAIVLRRQQILSRFEDIAPEFINDDLLRAPVVQNLVRQKAVELAAIDGGMAIPEKSLHQLLLSQEAFQSDGVFDASRYEFVIRQQGYTPTSYGNLLRAEMLTNQLVEGVIGTGFATTQEVELLTRIAEQKRNFYYLTIPAAPIFAKAEINTAEITAYYDANPDQFMSDEQVVVEYVELSADDLLVDTDVDEAMLREQYDAQITAAEGDVSRRVAHILIETGGDQTSLLDDLQAKLAEGADFAVLAKEYSMDYGTAEVGGDLGYSSAGDLPEAFESALSALEVDQISDPVSSDAGVHILKLLDIKTPEIASFEEQRDSLEQSLKLQLAKELLLERADELREVSYNAESLQATAEELGVELKVSQPFGRMGGQGIAAFSPVINASFGEDVLENGYSSEVLELSEEHIVVLALKQHIPVAVKALDTVSADIEFQLKATATAKQIEAIAERLTIRLRAGEELEILAKAESFEWQVSLDTGLSGGNLNYQIRQYVFSLPRPADQPVIGGLFINNGDHVLVSLNKVVQGDSKQLSADQLAALTASAAMSASNRDYQAYEQILVDAADIAIRD